MGYTTDFYGEFDLTPALSPDQVAYLQAFANTRRMKRDPSKVAETPQHKLLRQRAGLQKGPEGAYVLGDGEFGQNSSPDIVDYNMPPKGQPGLWCQWTPTDDGLRLTWDGGEKFYAYVEWLVYIRDHFLKPWGITLGGEVSWQGEDPDDRGKMIAENGTIIVQEGSTTYHETARL